ncbi:DUF1428 domain-containing protein [Aliiroseovarius crassostreae]|uniref:DUF1428 domain-containing protein n=1 Tax=Aliiroseovarius crassostreae TaxID=154981 RepID=UPI003C7A6AA8
MTYVDGFVMAVPEANKAAFVDHAHMFDQLFLEMGALRVTECWEDDVPDGKVTDFRRAVQSNEDEKVAFSWVEWPNKDIRDTAMAEMEKRMKDDPRFDPEKNPMPFEGRRMIFGGFSKIVDLSP